MKEEYKQIERKPNNKIIINDEFSKLLILIQDHLKNNCNNSNEYVIEIFMITSYIAIEYNDKIVEIYFFLEIIFKTNVIKQHINQLIKEKGIKSIKIDNSITPKSIKFKNLKKLNNINESQEKYIQIIFIQVITKIAVLDLIKYSLEILFKQTRTIKIKYLECYKAELFLEKMNNEYNLLINSQNIIELTKLNKHNMDENTFIDLKVNIIFLYYFIRYHNINFSLMI